MKILKLFFIFLILTFFSCQDSQKPTMRDLAKAENLQHKKDGVFIHVSCGYDNPHKTLMALSLANKMTETQDVTLFFDIEGVKLLTKTSEDIQMENFMTLHAALDSLIAHKVQIMACPMCTKTAGINPEDYKEGVIIAEKEKFFDFTKGRILTLDY